MKDEKNFNPPKPWPHAVNNSIIPVKKFTAVEICYFRNNATKQRSFFEHANMAKNFTTEFLRCKWLIFSNILDDFA